MSNMVPNTDSRAIMPLPYVVEDQNDGCTSVKSQSAGKTILTLWGADERDSSNHHWCTKAQRLRQVEYCLHAINHFPAIQNALEAIYAMEDMPEEAIIAIELCMEKVYYANVPPIVGALKKEAL